MKQQKSQRIYRKRVSVVVLHEGHLLGFNAEDPQSKKPYFFIPGGAIEEGESLSEAAARECFEETGYRVQIHDETKFTKSYEFFWDGQMFFTETTFFLGSLADPWTTPKIVKDASYHRGVQWIAISHVPEVFSYQSEIRGAVQKLLKLAQKRKARDPSII